MRRNLSGALALAGLLSAGCATVNTPVHVQRAPDILLTPAQDVALQIRTACEHVAEGPDQVSNTTRTEDAPVDLGIVTLTGSTSVTRTSLAVRRSECRYPEGIREAAAQVEARLKQILSKAGYAVVADGARGATLSVAVEGRESRGLENLGEHTDSGKDDHTCRDACKSTTCHKFRWSGGLEIKASVRGPDFQGHPQSASDFALAHALGLGTDSKVVVSCNPSQTEGEFADDGTYHWPATWKAAIEDSLMHVGDAHPLGSRFSDTFKPHTETYLAALFDTGIDADLNDKGVALAKQAHWPEAQAAFEQALAEQNAHDPDNREGVARIRHNIAVCKMVLEDLSGAADEATAARRIEASDETRALSTEIERRRLDREKLAVLGLAPLGQAAAPSSAVAPTETSAAVAAVEPPAVLPTPAPVEPPPVEPAPVEPPAEEPPAAVAPAAPVVAAPEPPFAPAPASPPVAPTRPCAVGGNAPVKFRTDASHTAKVTGAAPAGTPLRCFETKGSWRRVERLDGSVGGYLPEYLIRWGN
jgi:hypothetical protein